MNSVLAAIDLGSNSFHLSIVKIDSQGQRQVLLRRKCKVQLRAGLLKNGDLNPNTQTLALDCLSLFQREMARFQVEHVTAVGTYSFRQLANNTAFLKAAEAALNHPIVIVSGEEEARLIYMGALSRQHFDRRHLVIDIGGGSTELIIGESQHILALSSLDMGCVSFQQNFFIDGHLSLDNFSNAILEAEKLVAPIKGKLLKHGWQMCVGSSGTCKAIAGILREAGWKKGRITPQGLRYLHDQLLDLKHVKHIQLPGLREDRENVLAGGLAVLMGLFNALGIQELQLSRGAIREGMLQELIYRMMEKSA